MIIIDGSEGEGGGQILRTSLALSLVTQQPFRMERIRAKRQKPGLLRQHLTAVDAAKTVGCAEVTGAALNSQTLDFHPVLSRRGRGSFRTTKPSLHMTTNVTVIQRFLSVPVEVAQETDQPGEFPLAVNSD
jgi:RNA 3'-terminal phosphate cyclase (ATP)